MPTPSFKYLVCLTLSNSNAVVIDCTPKNAQLRASMMDKDQRDWSESSVEIIERVRKTRMNRVLAIERLE